MSASVTPVHQYRAYCLECGWWSDGLPTEHAADLVADDHDDEWHPES